MAIEDSSNDHYSNETTALLSPSNSPYETDLIKTRGSRSTKPEQDSAQKRHYRSKVIRGVHQNLGCFCVGMVVGQLGPSLLDLSLVTHTNVQQASAFLTALSAGNMAGALTSGFLYDIISKDLIMVASLFVLTAVTFALPFCSFYWLMIVVCFLVGASGIIFETVCMADAIRVWGKSGAMMQAVHSSFAVGGVVAPFITEPFLLSSNSSSHLNHSSIDLSFTKLYHSTDSVDLNSSDTVNYGSNDPVSSSKTDVRYAFVISSSMTLLISLSMLATYIIDKLKNRSNKHRQSIDDKKKINPETEPSSHDSQQEKNSGLKRLNLPLIYHTIVVISVLMFYILYVGVALTVPGYLTTFSVLCLGWTKTQGARLTSVFWICIASGRFVSIFLAKFYGYLKLLFISLTLMVPSFVGFLLSSVWGVDWGVQVSVGMMGVSMASVYACVVSWLNAELIAVNGRLMASIVLSANLGRTINPLILGHLLQHENAIWLTYLYLGEIILCITIFISLFLFSRFFLRPRYSCDVTKGSYVYVSTTEATDNSTSVRDKDQRNDSTKI